MTTVLPGAGLEVEDDLVDGKRVYPIGGIFFGAKGALSRVGSSNPLPVTLGGAQEISGTVSAMLTDPPTEMRTTREYALANSVLQAFTSASTAAVALPTLGTSREVRLDASAVCWLIWGASGVAAAAVAVGCLRVGINTGEVVRIPVGATHVRVIRETADGNLLITAVA